MAGGFRGERAENECGENRNDGLHDRRKRGSRVIRWREHKVKQIKKFKYHGSIMNENGGCQEDDKARIKAAWCNWRDISGYCPGQIDARDIKDKSV